MKPSNVIQLSVKPEFDNHNKVLSLKLLEEYLTKEIRENIYNCESNFTVLFNKISNITTFDENVQVKYDSEMEVISVLYQDTVIFSLL